MIDVHDFGRKLADKLLTISAENQGVSRIEAVRRYHTDARFKGTVDAIVMAAVSTIHEMEHVDGWDPLQTAFNEEASGLLGWQSPGSRH